MAPSVSILTPLLYVGVLLTALGVFSSVYRKRKMQALMNAEAWYPDNYAKELYFSIKDCKDDMEAHDYDRIAKSALIRWASEDLRQFIRMRENKQVLTTLHQRGSVGDEIWNRFNTSQKMLELELNDLAAEAEELHSGWSQQLFQTATEVAQNEAIRKRITDFPKQQSEYREAFERTRKMSLESLEK